MGMFAGILSSFVRKNTRNNVDDRSRYIFYKIVDSIHEDEEYVLQCINTKAIFHSKITDIILDVDILYGLHPIQACYIGIEYAKHIKKTSVQSTNQTNQKEKLNKYSTFRYGLYCILYQNRNSNICFVHQKTGEEILMDPRDIALSEELIQEFDAAQAFHIDLSAGLKLNNPSRVSRNLSGHTKRPYLRLVK